jgi:Carboxypeptidase regulatory-like domain/TonB dependent receptor
MKRICAAALTLLLFSFSIPAFSQGGFFATVAGTVTDTSGALIPGVTVKATAVDTGVVTDAVTNESGAYNFANLLPGKYTLSASLPGFQTKNLTDIQLSQNTSYRYNFQLGISGVNTQVEVSISADTMLATSGASIGQVLSQQKVQDLPMVGNNVLDLITVMAGVENVVPTNPPSAANAFGRENTTFAGVSAQNVAIVRDGIQVQDNRYPNGIYSVTTINPDLVGEIRLILAPVDAEMGRGNGAIQYSTRSGTNKFAGSAVWSFRNTALDPNTWSNNRNQTLPAGSPPGTLATATQPDWNNVHQGTVSFGGPIVKNKTFFFGLFDMNQVYQRTSTNFLVPTPCARLGIFRYFNGWNNAAGADGLGGVFGSTITTGATPQRAAVNLDGSPKPPTALPNGSTTNPNGSPFDPSLQYISVYGPLQSNPTTSDCSDAAINKSTLVPNGVSVTANPGQVGGGWDPYRKQLDPTGFISRTMDFYPAANNYEIGDGLNFAGYRVLRHFNGLDNLFGSGEATGIRKQFNVKIDHNFSANHKANVNWTYERVHSDDVVGAIPGMFSNQNFRRPMVVSAGFTSTLSATMLNEARFGMRRQGTNVIAPWDRDVYNDDLAKYFPAPVAGFDVIPQITTNGLAGIAVGSPAFCYPHSGARPPGGCGGGALTATSIDKTPTYTFADTLSWTRGAHAFKFGGELRLNSSEARTSAANFFGNPTYAKAVGGSITGTTQPTTDANMISQTTQVGTSIAAGANSAMPYLLSNNATNARSLSNYLSASLSNLTALYFLTDPNQLSAWSDFRNQQLLTTKLIQREFSAFVKDDYKLTKNLTLNLGVRWDYYGVPYVASGLTVAPVDGGDASFGISGRDFTGWMNPGRRAAPTAFEFVGPGSPNSSKTVYPNDYNNFGPAVGFAWQVPWFGEGKTTVRGGYQVTFQGGGRFNTLQGPLAAPPGSTLDPATPNWQNVYRDLTNVPTELPITPSVLPMQPIPLDRRTQTFTAFDPNYVDPYIQNLTLSVSRSVSRNVVLDVRYVGTLSRKNYTTLNLNSQNFIANGLVDDLNRARTGTEVPGGLLDQMFNGINLCTSALNATQGNCTGGSNQYGPIGSTTPNGQYQSAAYQMRNSTTFQGTLANGQYVSAPIGTTPLVTTIANFNYTLTGSNVGLPAITAGTVGAALRKNGFDENFIFTNPQFSTMNYFNNSGYSNYHSLEVSASLRPTHGFSGQATYTWSKNLGLPTTLTDPTNRALDYTNINNTPGHSLRTNSTIELPLGPNKLFFGNSTGWVARAIERWQLGLLYNLSSGYPQTITAQNMLYGNGVPDVVNAVDFNNLKGVRWGIPNGSQLEGRYFDNNDTFVKVTDPQCATLGAGLQSQCTLGALAMVVPAGTPGSTVLPAPDGRSVQIVLQNPQPGKRGTLGANSFIGLGTFRFDANLGKTFRISESKSLSVRFDAQNVLNHPQPAFSLNALTINGTTTPFGQLSTKTGARLFQGQLRLTF